MFLAKIKRYSGLGKIFTWENEINNYNSLYDDDFFQSFKSENKDVSFSHKSQNHQLIRKLKAPT